MQRTSNRSRRGVTPAAPPPQAAVRLKFHRPSIGPEEEQAVLEVLRSGWLTSGPKTVQFESEFAAYVGAKIGVGVTSCTAALHLGLLAMGIGAGDEVITAPMTFSSTVNVIHHVGAKPVFADVLEDTLTIDPKSLADRITRKTKAVIPIHFAGHACEMDEIRKIAAKKKLRILWDAAHAIETHYRGKPVGGASDATAYSFYATKNLTTGEGGMLTTDDAKLADQVKILRLHGMSRDAWKRYGEQGYKHWDTLEPGWKYNMFDLQAAVGLAQLGKLEKWLVRRKQICQEYDRRFAGIPEIRVLGVRPYGRSAYHVYPLAIRTEMLKRDRDQLLQDVQALGVGVGIHFRAVHLHEYYRKHYGFKRGLCPNAEYWSDRTLSIPLYPSMTDEDVKFVADSVLQVVETARRG